MHMVYTVSVHRDGSCIWSRIYCDKDRAVRVIDGLAGCLCMDINHVDAHMLSSYEVCSPAHGMVLRIEDSIEDTSIPITLDTCRHR